MMKTMDNNEKNILQFASGSWYIETRTGFEGPFQTSDEARHYLDLLEQTEAARAEFAGLQYTGHSY